jgi:fructose-1,6-bisphosphatase I
VAAAAAAGGGGLFSFLLSFLFLSFSHLRFNSYSINEGNSAGWSAGQQAWVASLKDPARWPGGKPYSARYIGSLVGDFHRTLLYGGIYGYPGDAKNPNGKLRLLYECAPMSFIAEQAGGAGSDGRRRILSITPHSVHQRTPFFIGSRKEVEYAESFLAGEEKRS